MSGKIQVGYLVSYDYELLKNSLPTIYKESDTIFLAIDKNRKTWKGDAIDINPDFFDWIKTFDVDNKIVLFEEEFYVPTLTTMQCEVRERKMLAEKMGIGNWLIQIDADEYFLDFKSFVAFLRSKNHFLKNPEKTPVQISPFLINLYKRLDEGLLFVEKSSKQLLATNFPSYKVGRQTRQRIIYFRGLILHECLSRTREELEFKLDNWGHNVDINKKQFLEKWETVNQDNYKSMENFFYLEPEKWKKLAFVKGTTIKEVEENLDLSKAVPSDFYILKKNFGQWFKFLFR
ncbi:hypothetical protein SAMN05443549_105216 [Flavobacterium fluvii]|uniref:Glycosyl transferase family 2 n=1 Tax=Flavobacterium fluvii TaxID=468056 RepID=A0A1M5LHT7_9FLAO|nr:hypothetical protein [Flavobacterium fluvii]SHG64611.1 hypothetical protein SAMN05443549_105216 [Flavobacterium fluvii]